MSDGFGETAILKEPRAAEADLSSQIEQAVQRDPLDRVKCVRVFDNFYRCNWWAQPSTDIANRYASEWGIVATQRVRKSRFLNATVVAGELVIKEMLPRSL
jgi:hypothetical protein